MTKKSNGNAKVKWARKEISRRTKGKHNSRQENANVMKEVWEEANDKFN